MAVLYLAGEIDSVMKELRIRPVDGMVNTNEVARILTWRAKAEQGLEHTYTVSAVRRHIHKGNLKAIPVSARFNQYKLADIFDLPLAPNRGRRRQAPKT